MRTLTIFTLLFLMFAFNNVFGQSKHPWRDGEKQIKVLTGTDQKQAADALNIIRNRESGLNIGYEEANGFIRCYVTPIELKYLNNSGLTTEIEIEDLNAFSNSFGDRGVPVGYYTVADLNEIADSLSASFPSICTKYVLGTGSGGHQISALVISDNSSTDEVEPELLFDGGIHGDEIGGPENMIRFARDLCVQYGTDPVITEAVNNAEIWIIYTINPFGRDNMTRYNANGVDINRDCGYMWNNEGYSNGIFSQPETKMIRDILREHQFDIHISYHSGTEFVSYPWSYRADLTPDNANHAYLAQEYVSNSGYLNLPAAPGYSGMYAINGSTKDFGYGATGAISWSVEISTSKQPPASLIGSYYLKNKNSMLAMVTNAIHQGIEGVVTDSITGEPVVATVFVNDFFPVNTNETNGDFHKFLIPGTYSIRIEANGYLSKEIQNVTIQNGQPTVLNAALTKGGGYYANSVISCQIINNNPSDEGNTPAAICRPDSISYSLGRNGLVIMDMGTNILNRTGNDLTVYENDITPEGYKVYVADTPDGPWRLVGTGLATTSFDISGTFLNKARYIKLTDDGDGVGNAPDAGFDLDAVENLHPDTLTKGWISGVVYNDQPEYFIIPGAIVSVNGNQVVAGENGEYIITLDPGEVTITATAPHYGGADTVTVVLGDTLVHDMHLSLTDNINITEKNTFFINPTLVDDHFVINAPEGQYYLELFNQQGILTDNRKISIGQSGYIYNTDHLSGGLYILRVSDSKESFTQKIIIAH